jgi:hypothetical protein
MKVKIAGAWKEILGIWCKVSGVWKPVSGIWNKVSGVFREETGADLGTGTLSDVEVVDNQLGLSKIVIGDYYNEGVEGVLWVTGYTYQSGEIVKGANHIYLRAYYDGKYSERTAVTDVAVDLTNAYKVKIDWYNDSSDSYRSKRRSAFVVSTEKMSSLATYDARIHREGPFSRRVDEIDVSGLTGNYYLRVHSRGEDGYVNRVYFYKVWAEDAVGNILYEYKPSGYRIWQPLDLSAAITATGSLIKFSKITPTGTTLKVYALLTDSDSVPAHDDSGWEEQTDGTALTVVTEDADMVGKLLYLKVEMSTTDPSVTPSLSRWYALVLGNGTTQWIKVS